MHIARRHPPLRTESKATASVFVRLLAYLLLWRDRARSRERLGAMRARELTDIGITRQQAMREARKPFWRD